MGVGKEGLKGEKGQRGFPGTPGVPVNCTAELIGGEEQIFIGPKGAEGFKGEKARIFSHLVFVPRRFNFEAS
jgi:hypothetical protein